MYQIWVYNDETGELTTIEKDGDFSCSEHEHEFAVGSTECVCGKHQNLRWLQLEAGKRE